MKISYAGEVEALALGRFIEVSALFMDGINKLIPYYNLNQIDIDIIYCPIVMPESLAKIYPPRSRYQKIKKTLNISPQIRYEIFLHGSLVDSLREYHSGLMIDYDLAQKSGMNIAQFSSFIDLIDYQHHHVVENLFGGNGDPHPFPP